MATSHSLPEILTALSSEVHEFVTLCGTRLAHAAPRSPPPARPVAPRRTHSCGRAARCTSPPLWTLSRESRRGSWASTCARRARSTCSPSCSTTPTRCCPSGCWARSPTSAPTPSTPDLPTPRRVARPVSAHLPFLGCGPCPCTRALGIQTAGPPSACSGHPARLQRDGEVTAAPGLCGRGTD